METKRYEKLTKIGEGAYGSVFKGKDNKTGSTIAIKSIKIDKGEEGISSTTLREISILMTLNHQNIVKLLDQYIDYESVEPKIELVFEYVNEDLSKVIKRKVLTKLQVRSYVKQLLQGALYMHSKRVFHRDLKPQNILVSQDQVLKIADFGLGRIVTYPLHTMSKEIETLWYRAPELLLGLKYYELAVDMWSIGCIFYEMAEGKVLFQTESELGQIMEIFHALGTPKQSQWPGIELLPHFKPTFPKFKGQPRKYNNMSDSAVDLLNKMIKINPKERITIKEALDHCYFND